MRTNNNIGPRSKNASTDRSGRGRAKWRFALLAAMGLLVLAGPRAGSVDVAMGQQLPPERPQGERGEGVPEFWVRPGYRVTVAADNLREARFMELGEDGTVYLSQPGAGTITALRDENKDGVYEQSTLFISGKKTVHGMCFKDGWLWFTTSGAIYKARPSADGNPPEVETVVPEGQLPMGGGHWWRSILVGDDGFYTSIGDSGNATDEMRSERQKIWQFDLDGRNKRLFASGIRNTEKLRFRPGTAEVWGADHGSDNFGQRLGERQGNQPVTDLNPPDEFNHYIQNGFYGHPFITGNRMPRLEFASRPDILQLAMRTIPPEWTNGAHWANNGWIFLAQNKLTGQAGDVLIAFHGSWNASVKAGYCIQQLAFDPVTGRPWGSKPIVITLSRQGDVLARPVDCLEMPDGSVLFSSDSPPGIYRLSKIPG